jgi:hypothetical protein
MKATIKKVKNQMNELEKMELLPPHGEHESERAKMMEECEKPELNQSRSWSVDSKESPTNLPLSCMMMMKAKLNPHLHRENLGRRPNMKAKWATKNCPNQC